MKKIALVVIAMVALMAIPVSADNTLYKAFVIGGKPVSQGSHWNFATVNFMIKSPIAINFWSFAGPRYKWNEGSNFIDLFVGCQFTDGKNGLFALSPRFKFSVGKFYVWQDLEWYTLPNSYYTETKAMLRIPKISGLDLGLDVSSFTPAPGKDIIWNIGPNAEYEISNQMSIGLSWQCQKEKFGGNYIMFTTSLFFF